MGRFSAEASLTGLFIGGRLRPSGIVSPLYPAFRGLVDRNGVTHLPFIVFKYRSLLFVIANFIGEKYEDKESIPSYGFAYLRDSAGFGFQFDAG